MGELFANFEAYDVQATRREAREEGIEQGMEQGIAHAIRMMKEVGISREVTKQQLIKQFKISPETAEENLKQHW